MNFKHKLALISLAISCLGATNAAQAETLYYDALTASSFSSSVTISGNPVNNNVMTGKYDIYDASNPNSWNSFIAYCFQPLQGISSNMISYGLGVPGTDPNPPYADYPGETYTSTKSLTVGGSPVNATALTDMQKLFDLYYADSLTSSEKSAGFQLALWEIQNENKATNGYSLATGDVILSNVANGDPGGPTGGSAVSAANGYLNLTGTASQHYVLTQWVNASSQDFISADIYVPPPLPEPMTLSLIALGLAGIAASRGRKLH